MADMVKIDREHGVDIFVAGGPHDNAAPRGAVVFRASVVVQVLQVMHRSSYSLTT